MKDDSHKVEVGFTFFKRSWAEVDVLLHSNLLLALLILQSTRVFYFVGIDVAIIFSRVVWNNSRVREYVYAGDRVGWIGMVWEKK